MTDITTESNLKAVLGTGARKLKSPGLGTEGGKSFTDTLAESLNRVNEIQQDADKAIEKLVSGKTQNIHETMLAVGKADMAFRMTMQVRNKIVEAYQEVLRMQV
ncbi:MAG: flagellar hook-basal body complex protein FliE [Nitrospinales bacterium]